jgi:ubiquinone biosynthesis protein UbiJ
MATRKMTFSLPAALAAQFVRRVSARERSRYVAEALAARLKERDRLLARAAEVANRSREVRTIEREFDQLDVVVAEPWDDAATR